MPFVIVRNNIVKVKADAIVNSANPLPVYGSGTDRAVYEAAGKEKLLEERKKIGTLLPGQAAATPAFALNAKYIIHTVGPLWAGGEQGEYEDLTACYRNSLELAKSLKCKSIAFPLISTGVYGFPKDKALRIAIDTITAFILKNDMHVSLVVFDPESFVVSGKINDGIKEIVDDTYVRIHARSEYGYMAEKTAGNEKEPAEETFVDRLFHKIDEKGLKPSAVYKKANMNRQHFSKLNCDRYYIPKKKTVIALCIALELDIMEAEELLQLAGYALSPVISFDRALKYLITQKEYDIFRINAYLVANDLPQLVPKEN